MTLEEAQARIIELTEENEQLTNERDSLSQNNNELTTECEKLRKMNQNYFNKLIAQHEGNDDPGEPEKEPISCEAFAATLNI